VSRAYPLLETKNVKTATGLLAIATVWLAGSGGLTAGEDNAQQTVRPLIVLTGTDSHVKERSYYRITSEEEWTKIWQSHKGEREPKDYAQIDFGKCIVIAIFQGSGWNSRGLKAANVVEEKARIVFRFEDYHYQTLGRGPEGGGNRVCVYGFFVLPRSNKAVVLEENVQNYLGQPPVWKERVKLPK
jgi:hypothetical protein